MIVFFNDFLHFSWYCADDNNNIFLEEGIQATVIEKQGRVDLGQRLWGFHTVLSAEV